MKPKKAILITIALLLVGSFGWLITRGNVIWRVHQNYPTATVAFAPVNSPDLAWGDFIRIFGIRFRSGSESISIRISDTTVDLNDFRGMSISYLTLTRCRVADIRAVLSEGHPDVAFDDCDLSAVPPDQLRFLGTIESQPTIRTVGNFFLRDGFPRSYPGVTPLHRYSLFP